MGIYLRSASRSRCFLVGALLSSAGLVLAHPGIDQQLADLTLRVNEQPENAELRVQRGELHRIHRDWPAAQADFERARELDPDLTSVDFMLGKLKLDAGDPAGARKALRRFLAKEPDHARARIELARALVEPPTPSSRKGRRSRSSSTTATVRASPTGATRAFSSPD